jgi:hypothetical protein
MFAYVILERLMGFIAVAFGSISGVLALTLEDRFRKTLCCGRPSSEQIKLDSAKSLPFSHPVPP